MLLRFDSRHRAIVSAARPLPSGGRILLEVVMPWTRREFFAIAAAAPAALRAAPADLSGLRIGVTDWNLRKTGSVEAVAFAKMLGFEGVEVSLGRRVAGNKLPLDNPELQDR